MNPKGEQWWEAVAGEQWWEGSKGREAVGQSDDDCDDGELMVSELTQKLYEDGC